MISQRLTLHNFQINGAIEHPEPQETSLVRISVPNNTGKSIKTFYR